MSARRSALIVILASLGVGIAAGAVVWRHGLRRRPEQIKGSASPTTRPGSVASRPKALPPRQLLRGPFHVPPPDVLAMAAKLTSADVAKPPDPRDAGDEEMAAWRTKMWAALYSPDPAVWQTALENLHPFAAICMNERMLKLAREAGPAHRTHIARHLAVGVARAAGDRSSSDYAAVHAPAEVALATAGVVDIIEGLTDAQFIRFEAWRALGISRPFTRHIPDATATRLLRQCIRAMRFADPKHSLQTYTLTSATGPLCGSDDRLREVVRFVDARLKEDPKWPLRRSCIQLFAGFHRTEIVRPIMKRAMFDDEFEVQKLAFNWLRGWADRYRPGGEQGTDHERTWIVSKVGTSPPQARAALIRYIGRRWGAVQANRLDASTVMLDLTPHELKLFKAQRPHPLLVQTVLEINEPG